MTLDQLYKLQGDLAEFGKEFCQTNGDGLQNYEQHFRHSQSIVQVVIERKIRQERAEFIEKAEQAKASAGGADARRTEITSQDDPGEAPDRP